MKTKNEKVYETQTFHQNKLERRENVKGNYKVLKRVILCKIYSDFCFEIIICNSKHPL